MNRRDALKIGGIVTLGAVTKIPANSPQPALSGDQATLVEAMLQFIQDCQSENFDSSVFYTCHSAASFVNESAARYPGAPDMSLLIDQILDGKDGSRWVQALFNTLWGKIPYIGVGDEVPVVHNLRIANHLISPIVLMTPRWIMDTSDIAAMNDTLALSIAVTLLGMRSRMLRLRAEILRQKIDVFYCSFERPHIMLDQEAWNYRIASWTRFMCGGFTDNIEIPETARYLCGSHDTTLTFHKIRKQ